ncbi:MAG: hypothetical protein CM15mP54_08890 [Paracoccaceae bacterium]|nr:MAG: hypothetical protein CM15mP54_08890 [Paracoccaceae bacterium]
MKKLFVLICTTLFLAQPLFSAGYGSSDTSSSGSSGKDKKQILCKRLQAY